MKLCELLKKLEIEEQLQILFYNENHGIDISSTRMTMIVGDRTMFKYDQLERYDEITEHLRQFRNKGWIVIMLSIRTEGHSISTCLKISVLVW